MKSIALKMWIGMMMLVVFMLLLLWLFQITWLESFYTQQQISRLKSDVESIGENWTNMEEERLEKLSYDYNSYVEITDSEGNVIYSYGSSPGGYGMGRFKGQSPMMNRSFIYPAFIKEVLSGKLKTERNTHPRFGTEIVTIGTPLKSEGKITGAMFISMPLAPVEETASILKQQLIYITLALLIAAVIISYFMSRAFSKPILKIDRAALDMASGDLSVRLESKSKDEIGRLTYTMNYLALQLSRTEQLRRDFIANVSHELRTPLSLIRGYAETIRDISGEKKDKRDKHLEIIIEESERLGKIVDDILNLSQIQAGCINLDMKDFSLNGTLENVVKRYDVLSNNMDIAVMLDAGKSLRVKGDETKIEQVLYNLINNAFNHISNGGTISVSAVDQGYAVRVSVSDTGEGIPRDKLDHIWDRYYKADKSSGRKRVGTGLGLAIVKSILEAHKSRFGVESREGKGTTFWFELEKSV